MVGELEETLKQRGGKYGLFHENAAFAQTIKDLFRNHPGWHRLSLEQREAFDLMATKFSRCMTGDPFYKDNWTDIAGYAQLIANVLAGEPM